MSVSSVSVAATRRAYLLDLWPCSSDLSFARCYSMCWQVWPVHCYASRMHCYKSGKKNVQFFSLTSFGILVVNKFVLLTIDFKHVQCCGRSVSLYCNDVAGLSQLTAIRVCNTSLTEPENSVNPNFFQTRNPSLNGLPNPGFWIWFFPLFIVLSHHYLCQFMSKFIKHYDNL